MNNKEYKDLAPISNIENGQEYINALDWALENNNIRNIALSGPYGSGKSSIINTYIKNDEEKNKLFKKSRKSRKRLLKTSLKISMATFVQDKSLSEENFSINQNEVEQGILKQLFYKVEHKKYLKADIGNFM